KLCMIVPRVPLPPITDPYVVHHGSLGSFASVYSASAVDTSEIVRRLGAVPGIELVLERRAACRRLELPEGRTGAVVVCADGGTVLGSRPDDHDLAALHALLGSHRGLAERDVHVLWDGE